MKYCSKCGSPVNEGINFCPKCGFKLSQQFQQPTACAGAYVQVQASQYYNAAPLPPALKALKGIGTSPVFLVAVIAYTLTTILSFITSLTNSSQIISIVHRALYELDLGYLLHEIPGDIFYFISRGNAVLSFITMIPSLIIITGLWLIFAACINKRSSRFSTAGLTTVKVMNIIGLVFTCLSAAIVEIVLLILAISISSNFGSIAVILTILIMLFALAAYAISIIYYAKINKTINSAKTTVLTGTPHSYASRFVGVLCFISAVGSLFSIFGYIISGHPLVTIFGIMTSLCSCAASTCFGITIFNYRSKISAVANSKNVFRPIQAPVTTTAATPPVKDDIVPPAEALEDN